MRSITYYRSIFLCLCFIAVCFIPASAFAAGTLTVRPAKVELTLAPGETKTALISVENSTAMPLTLALSFEDIEGTVSAVAGEDPVHLLEKNKGNYSLKDYLSSQALHTQLLSGERMQLPVLVTLPLDASPGGRYGSVVITFKPAKGAQKVGDSQVSLEERVAVLFFVRVSGVTKEEGSLEKFSLFNNARYLRQSNDPLQLQIVYRNTGNVHLNPYGKLTLSRMFGESKIIGVDPWAVLPGAERMREIDVQEPLPAGYYTALLEQNRGYGDVIDTTKVWFVVLPTMMQTFIGLIVLALLVLIIRKSLSLSRHMV